MTTITETCSCGAKFTYASSSHLWAADERARFAAEHQACRRGGWGRCPRCGAEVEPVEERTLCDTAVTFHWSHRCATTEEADRG